MGKKIKLGNYEPTLTSVKVYEYDDHTDTNKLMSDHCDTAYGVSMQVDMDQLAQSIAFLNTATKGKVTAAKFLDRMIKTSPDILDDQVFDLAKVALKACLSRVSKQESMYYHPLAAALAVCEDITEWKLSIK